MFLNPHKNNTEKIKLFAVLFIVLFTIFAVTNYYFVYKYTQFKGRMKKLNIAYIRIVKISIFHALVATIFSFLTFKAFGKNDNDNDNKKEISTGGNSTDDYGNSSDYHSRRNRRHRRKHHRSSHDSSLLS
jgi:formate hydrogenlyase subunit 3/multisubunit Na+/H+ antiporter MnhD subunit